MKYQIQRATRNAGEYVAGESMALNGAKSTIRSEHPKYRMHWRQEGDEIAAYVSAEDMTDEDKAVARLRPAGEREL